MKPNFLDRVVGYFNPVEGMRRVHARNSMSALGGFSGAKKTGASFKNWRTTHNSADADLIPDLKTLRERSRDLERNHPLAHGAINTVVSNVVGGGLTLQSAIDGDFLGLDDDAVTRWQNHAEREFRLWSESQDCDLTRTQNFAGLQDLAFRGALTNGDSFSLLPSVPVKGMPYKTRVQMIEADRVCNRDDKPDNNKIVAGIHLDEHGAPVEYDILTVHPGSLKRDKRAWETYAAFGAKTGRRNVIHLFERRRPGQNRGMPYLTPVIEPLKQLGRYTDAELMSAVVSSMFTVFIKTEDGQGSMLGPESISNAASQKHNTPRDYSLGTGNIVEGLPGDSIEIINPGRPNSEFDPFVYAILKQVGIALEIPLEVLMKSFTSSYSAAKAALQDAWRFFLRRRKWLASMFCQPIYETWLTEAVAIGRINAPGFFTDPMIRKAYCGATWHGDGMGSLDPLKEASAAEKRMDIKLTSLAQEKAAYDGGDWEKTVRQRNKELANGGQPANAGSAEPSRSDDDADDNSGANNAT